MSDYERPNPADDVVDDSFDVAVTLSMWLMTC